MLLSSIHQVAVVMREYDFTFSSFQNDSASAVPYFVLVGNMLLTEAESYSGQKR